MSDAGYPTSNHPADMQAEKIILSRILSGDWPEGTRLPKTPDLAEQLNLGVNSVQQALARLSTMGYLERKPRLGTIVLRRQEERKPSVMVLVGPDLKHEAHYMDRRLTVCLESELSAAGYVPHVYDNLIAVQDPEHPARQRTMDRLIRDFTTHDPIGIIESTVTFKRFLELASEFGRPSVSIKGPTLGGDVYSDHEQFIRECLHYLAQAGKKRVVWALKVTGKVQDSRRFDRFWKDLRSHGLECARLIEINDQDASQNPETVICERVRSFVRENRTLPPAKRADCLLVDEDILMRGASLGLLSEQVRVPEELLVCTHTNEGIDLHYGVPVVTYENPISELARQATNLLTTRILKRKEPPVPILIPGKLLEPAALRKARAAV